MDSSNYKLPKRKPIDYGPKVKPKSAIPKPINLPVRSLKAIHPKPISAVNGQSIKPPKSQSKPTPFNQPVQKLAPQQSPLGPKAEAVYFAPVKTKKKRKTKGIFKKALIVLLVITLLGLLAGGGYFGYKKYKESKKPVVSSNTEPSNDKNGVNASVSTNPILSADYIVYGTKQGSLFVTNKSEYTQDPNVASVIVVAKSSYPNDNREITINQQKVASNFSSDPQGLKKIADSIGPNTPLTTTNGTSYIITGNATGLTVIGATLISVRTSASLAIAEWQQIFNDLQPVQI
jgi:hypothetical protein